MQNNLKEELRFEILREIDNYILGLEQDKRSIAFMCLQSRYIERAKSMAKYKKISCVVKDVDGDDNWKTIFFYKYDFGLDIINGLPKVAVTTFDHWLVGKACGYSDKKIASFVHNLDSQKEKD